LRNFCILLNEFANPVREAAKKNSAFGSITRGSTGSATLPVGEDHLHLAYKLPGLGQLLLSLLLNLCISRAQLAELKERKNYCKRKCINLMETNIENWLGRQYEKNVLFLVEKSVMMGEEHEFS
jgi:hypothetical protein